ncbi:MAG: hypothetical protein ACR2IA_06655 [Pyrinomonadaceae bacterium]
MHEVQRQGKIGRSVDFSYLLKMRRFGKLHRLRRQRQSLGKSRQNRGEN